MCGCVCVCVWLCVAVCGCGCVAVWLYWGQGFTVSRCTRRYFDRVESYEIDRHRFAQLEHNVRRVACLPPSSVGLHRGDFLSSVLLAGTRGVLVVAST